MVEWHSGIDPWVFKLKVSPLTGRPKKKKKIKKKRVINHLRKTTSCCLRKVIKLDQEIKWRKLVIIYVMYMCYLDRSYCVYFM